MAQHKFTKKYKEDLHSIVTKLFDECYNKGWTWDQFATKAGVSYNTVFYLGNRNTRFPQFRTLQLLAGALGGSLTYKNGMATGFKSKKKILRLKAKDVRKPRLSKVG